MAQEEYNEEEYDEEMEGEEELFDKPGWLTEMPYWAVSAILHIILILIIGGLVLSRQITKEQKKVDMVAKLKKKPPKYDPKKKRDLKRTPKILNPKIIKEPVIKRKIDEVTTDIPKGTDLNNLSNVNQNSTMVNDAIGVGGGAAGAYGHRYGKGSLTREGGSEGTESAVQLLSSGSIATRMRTAAGRPRASTMPAYARDAAPAPTRIPIATRRTSAGKRTMSASRPWRSLPSPASATPTWTASTNTLLTVSRRPSST